ncbi:sensor histidine kinase [Aquimarina sediminis]|uniref:sensor histidine kinase n=1 Tax=Aquimarina sediminis TaxID=2070536 RepID=UPI000CA07CB2|nr:histidine kinase [Aquimarina sediminis]
MVVSKYRWKYHVLLGVLIIIMDMYGDYIYKQKNSWADYFEYPLFLYTLAMYTTFFCIYILNYKILCPFILSRKRILQYISGVILLVFLYAGIRYLLEEVLLYSITGLHNYGDNYRHFRYYVFDNSYYASKSLLFSTAIYLFFRFVDHQDAIHRLKIENKKAELNLLKSQLDPHFLFNTLNSFYSDLIQSEPKIATDIHRLSGLLRFVTYETQQETISLQKDLKFISDYIFFYKKRYEDNLAVDYQVHGTVANQKIPAMLLIHFIENVFKHGIVNDSSAPATITITIHSKNLEIHTKNKKALSEKYLEEGIGYMSIHQRLSILFKNDFTLYQSEQKSYFEAYLKIPI